MAPLCRGRRHGLQHQALRSGAPGIDKGSTEAYTDSDGERHGEGLGDRLSAESDRVKAKVQKRNQLRALEAKHREAGAWCKADNIRNNSSSRMKADQQEAGPTPRPWVPWDQWAVIVGTCLAHRHRLPERSTRQQSLTGSREEVPDREQRFVLGVRPLA